jgi:hypothetical protein
MKKKRISLDDIPRHEAPFSVPEHYFEHLPHQIQQRVQKSRRAEWLEAPFNVWPQRIAAAMLLLLLAGALFTGYRGTRNSGEYSLYDIPAEQIEQYLLLSGISEADLLESVREHEQILPILPDYISTDILENELQTHDLEDYW